MLNYSTSFLQRFLQLYDTTLGQILILHLCGQPEDHIDPDIDTALY
jgi:hypothetical protein